MNDKWSKESTILHDKEAKDMDNGKREDTYIKAYKKIINILNLTKNDNVLDIGCGTGKMAIAINNNVKSYIGIDVSSKALDIANKNKTVNQSFLKEDMTKMSFEDNSFDKIIALTSIDQVFNKQEALFECYRVLNNNGILYMEVRNSDYIIKKIFKVFLPILNLLKITKEVPISGFKDLNNREWEKLIDENKFEIIEKKISIRPFYGESLLEKIKHSLIEICKYVVNKNSQYMLVYILKKNEIKILSLYNKVKL